MTRFEETTSHAEHAEVASEDLTLIHAIADGWSPPEPTAAERTAFQERILRRAERLSWRTLPDFVRVPAAVLGAAAALLLLMQGIRWQETPLPAQSDPGFASSAPSAWEFDLFDPPEFDVWGGETSGLGSEMLPADYAAIESSFL